MKVGLFTDTYLPDINGVVTSIVTLKESLEKEGHTVFVITNQPTVGSSTFEDNILRLPGIELKFLYGYTFSSPLHLSALETIRNMDLDVIHIHTEFGIGVFGRTVAKQLHIPAVSTYHTQYEDYTHYVNFFKLKSVDDLSRKLVASLSRMYSKSVQIVISPSEKTKKMLLRYDIRKEIVVIPTGIDLERFKNVDMDKVKSIRENYNTTDKFVITYIGRLAEEKSVDVAIKGFAKMYETRQDARLMIVGGGPDKDGLEKLAASLGLKDAVIFTGPVPSSDVPAYYHASNAFVSASLTETQGLTYIEALACKLCVFARFDKPLEEIVLEDRTGFLFEDEAEFATKLSNYIDLDESEKERIRGNAEEVLLPYDSVMFANNVVNVYQKAIDSFYGKYVIEEYEEEGEIISIKLSQDGFYDVMTFDKDVLGRRDLEVGMELSRNEITSFEDDQKIYEAYQMSLKRIAFRDYTSYEMIEYLNSKMDLSLDQMDAVIETLKRRRFIDDQRYLTEKVYYYREQLRGNQWIIEDLTKRGISEAEIIEALEDELHEDYIARGVKRANRFMISLKDGSRLQRSSKFKQHMKRQGYEYDVIREIQAQLTDPYEKDQERQSLENVMAKSYPKYLRRYENPTEARERTIKHAMSRGYSYDMIKEVLEGIISNEN